MSKKYGHISSEERHIFASYLKDGLSLRNVAKKLNRSASTLSYEIQLNSRDGTREGYNADSANFFARMRKWDANSRNPLKNEKIWSFVIEKLIKRWSPQQITGTLEKMYPDDKKLQISHETIYQFINSKEGRALNLHMNLRRRKLRKPKKGNFKSTPKKETIPNRVPISKRPKIVSKKTRYGDWESDLMESSRKGKMALSVQKERKSQYMQITLVQDKSAEANIGALKAKLSQYPKEMLKTITFDNGRENTKHEKLTAEFDIMTYFCDPYCSWQKGSVENGIGLIRDYLPKGTNLNEISEKRIRMIEKSLNNRPRKCLGYKTPNEVFSNHLKKLGVRLPD